MFIKIVEVLSCLSTDPNKQVDRRDVLVKCEFKQCNHCTRMGLIGTLIGYILKSWIDRDSALSTTSQII